MRVAVLDDYQHVAMTMADWTQLPGDVIVTCFTDHQPAPDVLAERLSGYEIVCIMRERTPFTREVFTKLPDLKLLITTGMRNASVDMQAAADHGVTVCGTSGSGHPTPELAFGLILSLARNIPNENAAMRHGHWQTKVGLGLKGRTLGLLGLGKLGSRVAQYAQAFEMNLIAWSQNLTAEAAAAKGVQRVEKDELFRQSDFLSVHLVLSERSRGLVGARELGLMKPTAYIVNTSRGPIIDEAALAEALQQRRIAGAGLDTYGVEPVPKDCPFLDLPNTVLTPHLGYVTEDTYEIFYGETVENILAWLKGEPVRVITA
ncbi:MAG: D-2-hydroxyacid dehydrogenase family protein [Alphaproteobacteria bacterium]|nr:D-2-hydroxyacid dehydrogenase family protein [Alphaproteobacteria bacterium]MCB9931329.1 D-2-hydroxyacid dehydrogenase family protein [Alphaproteobacteria bacterium]